MKVGSTTPALFSAENTRLNPLLAPTIAGGGVVSTSWVAAWVTALNGFVVVDVRPPAGSHEHIAVARTVQRQVIGEVRHAVDRRHGRGPAEHGGRAAGVVRGQADR